MGLFLNILSMLLNNNSSQQRMNNVSRQILENEIGKQLDILGQEIEREEKHLKKVRSQLDKDIEFLNSQGCPVRFDMDTETFNKTINEWYENKWHEKLGEPTQEQIKEWNKEWKN